SSTTSGRGIATRPSGGSCTRRPEPGPTVNEERGEVEVEGGRVRYRILGEGERTLVLLHGGPGGGSLYLRPLARLAGPDRRVVLYDQLGCGESDRPDDPSLWRADRFVGELETLRAHLGLEAFDLYGHSW